MASLEHFKVSSLNLRTEECSVARIVKIPTQTGQQIEGEEVDFKAVSEPWSVYQLQDGYTVRMKLVVTQIVRTSQRDPDGNPVYIARSSNVMTVSPPETYKKGELQ